MKSLAPSVSNPLPSIASSPLHQPQSIALRSVFEREHLKAGSLPAEVASPHPEGDIDYADQSRNFDQQADQADKHPR